MVTTEDQPAPLQRLKNQLRRLRKDAGLTQNDVAGALAWPTSRVNRTERGHIEVTTSDLSALLELYGRDRNLAEVELRRKPVRESIEDSGSSKVVPGLAGLISHVVDDAGRTWRFACLMFLFFAGSAAVAYISATGDASWLVQLVGSLSSYLQAHGWKVGLSFVGLLIGRQALRIVRGVWRSLGLTIAATPGKDDI